MSASISRRALLGLAGGTLMGIGSVALNGAAATTGANRPRAAATGAGDPLLKYDAVDLAELVRAGEVTPLALVKAAARRITALDGDLNAMTTLTTERAFELAEKITADSVFAGVPTVLKDLVDLGGVRRTNGSLMNLASVPDESVDYVKAMEAAGLNILGMTNTPEFASLALTDNAAFGVTRNPWNLQYSAGGSSGGSGAAVAAGYVPIAHGTDGGGSNRIPASCCGVLGMKASRYRQVSGEAGGGHQFLRTHQCLSRTVRDSAALLAATEDRNNKAGYKPVGLVSGPGRKRLRIAVSSKNAFGQAPDAGVQKVLENTAALCQSLGHTVVETANPVDGMAMFQALEGVMLANTPGLLDTVESLTGRKAEAGLLTLSMVAIGRHGASLPSGAREKGLAYFRQLTSEFARFHGSYEVWLTPTIPMETPLVGYINHDMPVELLLERNRAVLSYTAVANGVGAPAMSVPLFHSTESGLPVGSMFMAAPGADRTLYELAFELEAAMPWVQRWAPHSAMYVS
jgi:amidase